MSLRTTVVRTLQARLGPTAVGHVGAAYLSVRGRRRCRVSYDDGLWIHRYASGVLVDTRLGGPTPEGADRGAADVFFYDYTPSAGDTVIDLGAGVGTEVRLMSRLVGPEGRVIAIEAHPETTRCLRRMVAENALDNVTVVECAVVGTPGPVTLLDESAAHISHRLGGEGTGGIEVPGRTLDEIHLTLGLGRVDLLKINIEGAEQEVLASSERALELTDHAAVSCHDFVADRPGQGWQRTFDAVSRRLAEVGFDLRTRPDDPRPWVPYYVYASRHAALDRASRH